MPNLLNLIRAMALSLAVRVGVSASASTVASAIVVSLTRAFVSASFKSRGYVTKTLGTLFGSGKTVPQWFLRQTKNAVITSAFLEVFEEEVASALANFLEIDDEDGIELLEAALSSDFTPDTFMTWLRQRGVDTSEDSIDNILAISVLVVGLGLWLKKNWGKLLFRRNGTAFVVEDLKVVKFFGRFNIGMIGNTLRLSGPGIDGAMRTVAANPIPFVVGIASAIATTQIIVSGDETGTKDSSSPFTPTPRHLGDLASADSASESVESVSVELEPQHVTRSLVSRMTKLRKTVDSDGFLKLR